MGTNYDPFYILVGVGTVYIADTLTAMPDVDADMSGEGDWTELGHTEGGVKFTKTRKVEYQTTDQSVGNIKASLTDEGITLETKLAEITLENLGILVGQTVTDTPAGVGTIGYKTVGLLSGDVTEHAVLFRSKSPYGDFNAQYYVARGVFDGDVAMSFTKNGKVTMDLKYVGLYDAREETAEKERWGVFVAEDAVATT